MDSKRTVFSFQSRLNPFFNEKWRLKTRKMHYQHRIFYPSIGIQFLLDPPQFLSPHALLGANLPLIQAPNNACGILIVALFCTLVRLRRACGPKIIYHTHIITILIVIHFSIVIEKCEVPLTRRLTENCSLIHGQPESSTNN